MICELHDEEMQSKTWPDTGKTTWSHKVVGEGYCNGERIKPFKTDGGAGFQGRASELASQARSMASGQGETKDWHRVERQHSQEMALRFLALSRNDIGTDDVLQQKVKELTDWFISDLEN